MDGPAASDLATVLRRVLLDPGFAAEVRAEPLRALAAYRLSAADLAALALLLDHRAPRPGLTALFAARPPTDDGVGPDPDPH